MKTRIYLDNAATTKTSQEVVDAMLPYFTEDYGNASSIYEIGQRSREAITKAREQIAQVIGAKTEEIYFTACLLYTSPSPRDISGSRMPSSA